MKAVLASLVVLATASMSYTLAGPEAIDQAAEPTSAPGGLLPTDHPPLPRELSEYWLVPDDVVRRGAGGPSDPAMAGLARGVKAIAGGQFAVGLPLVSAPGLEESSLSDYAKYYHAIALQGLSRLDEADALIAQLAARPPAGALGVAVQSRLAELAMARQDPARAETVLRAMASSNRGSRDEVLSRLGQAEEAVGHTEHAADAYRSLYVSYPNSAHAAEAKAGLERLAATVPLDQERARAERLFASRRWSDARAAFESIVASSTGTDRDHATVRIAQCEDRLGRHRAARDRLAPLLTASPADAEVRYAYLTAVRGTGDRAAYVRLTRALVDEAPDSPWAVEALNELASYYVIGDEDDKADEVFREMLQRYPGHRYAERAAWKVGWAAYRGGRVAEAVSVFETAAARFRRSDYRPSWLYWSARGRDRLQDRAGAAARYALVVGDYGESYYGRLAARFLAPQPAGTPSPTTAGAPRGTGPPTESLMRALMSAGLYDDALREVQYAQQTWGDSPRLQATAAWIRYQQAQDLRGDERFAALRGAITLMRRAYPQFLSADGASLPPDVLRIIYPLDYWDLIKKYSAANDLDPYLISALMAQESTFTAEIRSSANARGLMQVMPATGRLYARKLRISRFSTRSLSEADTNVKIGVRYFKDLVDRFGGVAYALASYNAGDVRVAEWMKTAPDLPDDEFIDSIPFPETQNYVRRILGTTEDYRRLYGTGLLAPNARQIAAAAD